MGTHDADWYDDDADEFDDTDDFEDEPDDWGARRIADLKGQLAEGGIPDLNDDGSADDFDDEYLDAGDPGEDDLREADLAERDLPDADRAAARPRRTAARSRVDPAADDHRWWERVLARIWWRWRWLIPLSALLIPIILLVGGLVVLTILSDDDSESASESPAATAVTDDTDTPVQAEWPPGVAFVEHTIPAMIRDDLAYAGAARGYLFVGAVGDTWTIEVEPNYDSALDPMVRVYGPDGHELATNDNRVTGDPSAAVVVRLPEDGEYRVVIQAAGEGLTTGDYWLTVSENTP